MLMKFRPLEDDGGKDIEGYNKELEQRGYPSWLDTEWLFSECYLYRYVVPTHTSDPTPFAISCAGPT